jgi:arabinofuranosyltransferase
LPRFENQDGRSRKALLAFGLAVLLIVLAFEHRQFGSVGYEGDGRYDVAVMLSHYREKNYSLATTDAGILPFYSQWRSIDSWGLNDQWITHHGSITESYLDRYKPQVIMFEDRYIS